jgi:hypothetical protein
VSRYEIREQEISEELREFWLSNHVYVVWDAELDKSVPFGRYHTRESAQRRIDRMEAR